MVCVKQGCCVLSQLGFEINSFQNDFLSKPRANIGHDGAFEWLLKGHLPELLSIFEPLSKLHDLVH